MIDRLPRRFRFGFARADEAAVEPGDGPEHVPFIAYGEDCIVTGHTILDADRLTDMLNLHDEYDLADVTVERFDDGEPLDIPEISVARDEIILVQATGPRGDESRRHRTMPQHLALQMGPYKVRGFFHALPGADPVVALRRRKTMVPLTDARIQYTIRGEQRETSVDTVIVNRDQIDWVQELMPTAKEFPQAPSPARLVTKPARRVAAG
jgi:hypothetical protein